jgi:acetyltransferase-like isoleucine patch superfamily enzyme
MGLRPDRRIEGDWYDGPVPAGVRAHPETHLDSAFVFANVAGTVEFRRGAHIYSGSILDVGERGHIEIGECAMLNGVYIVCDSLVEIGAYATISWNVVFMDTYRMPFSPEARRLLLEQRARDHAAQPKGDVQAKPVRLRDNVWIGFDVCVLPGVTIGEGSVVGARSVVAEDVPPYTIVAGNPARPIRRLEPPAPGDRGERA